MSNIYLVFNSEKSKKKYHKIKPTLGSYKIHCLAFENEVLHFLEIKYKLKPRCELQTMKLYYTW